MKNLKMDRALAEVREWRERVREEYELLNALPPDERAARIKEFTAEFRKRHNLNLPRVSG